jgi:secreted trypsin-like serine protease
VGLVITANEVCGETAVATGVCYGDSGGPLTRKATDGTWRLVGSASRSGAGEACGSGGDIFTDVTAYARWIRYVMSHGRTPTAAPQRTGNLRTVSGLTWPALL